MFWNLLGESIARATFWILIIFAVGITVRYLIRDYITFVLEDVDKKTTTEE